jgi:hypothetical protein
MTATAPSSEKKINQAPFELRLEPTVEQPQPSSVAPTLKLADAHSDARNESLARTRQK